jgi:hypothetical protein
MTPASVQRKMRMGRVRERGMEGWVSKRKRKPLRKERQAARTTRVMEARRRWRQVVAVRKKAVSTRAKRENRVRKKEITRPRSRSMVALGGSIARGGEERKLGRQFLPQRIRRARRREK